MCTRFQIFIRLSTMYSTILTDHWSRFQNVFLNSTTLSIKFVHCPLFQSSVKYSTAILHIYRIMSWTVCLLVLNTIIFQNRWQFFPSIHNNFLYSTKISIDPQLFPSIHNNFLYSTKVSIVPQLFSFSTILSFIPHDCLYNSPVYTPHWSKYCSLSTILCSFLHQLFTIQQKAV